jgi:hypothetical protein
MNGNSSINPLLVIGPTGFFLSYFFAGDTSKGGDDKRSKKKDDFNLKRIKTYEYS